MLAYIGCKIILAEPMTKDEFDFNFKGVPITHAASEPGYHV